MQYKYLVELLNDQGELKEFQTFKTRKEITEAFNLPLYIVDKVIKSDNDLTVIQKRKFHRIYQDTVKSMKIYFIKPMVI